MRSNVTMFVGRGSLGGARNPGRISALTWRTQCGHWDGWGGQSGVGRGAETKDLFGSIYGEKYRVGMVSHGMALGYGLLNRLVLPPFKRRTPGTGG